MSLSQSSYKRNKPLRFFSVLNNSKFYFEFIMAPKECDSCEEVSSSELNEVMAELRELRINICKYKHFGTVANQSGAGTTGVI